jgi:GDPmannose 4,6-dehydratase
MREGRRVGGWSACEARFSQFGEAAMSECQSRRRTALITGASGQDGSYLADLLIGKGYDVHGIVRRTSQIRRENIDGAREAATASGATFALHYANLSDPWSLARVIGEVRPDELYNLASESHVAISFDEPENSANVNGLGVLRLLEVQRHLVPECRFVQASSADLFGSGSDTGFLGSPQEPLVFDERSPFSPRSPYAIAKQFAHSIVRFYRDVYGLHASTGILFNHESPRRGKNFVSRKITATLAAIRRGAEDTLWLGDLNAFRDWGYAPDYVAAMWLIAQQDQPDDYVLATGEQHSVREFVECAAASAGFKLEWEGSGLEERGIDRNTGATIVRIDPRYFRRVDHSYRVGNASKAKVRLGWSPTVRFEELVHLMMDSDLRTPE